MNRISPRWPVLVGTLSRESHLQAVAALAGFGSQPLAADGGLDDAYYSIEVEAAASASHPIAHPIAHSQQHSLPDWLELRLDSLDPQPWNRLPSWSPPLLITARDPREGGDRALDLPSRLQLLTEALPHAAALDLEWANFPDSLPHPSLASSSQNLLLEARQRGVLVIASAHNFSQTPPAAELRALVEAVAHSPHAPDLLKLACRLHGPADLARLLELLDDPPLPLALMGMGPLGPAARLALTAAGSQLLYGYQVEANAPGQMSIAALRACENLWRVSPA